MNNIKIGKRLLIANLVLIVFTIAVGVTGYLGLNSIKQGMDRLLNVTAKAQNMLSEMSEGLHIVSRVTRTLVILTDQKEIEEQAKKIPLARGEYNHAWDELKKLEIRNEETKALMKQIEVGIVKVRELNNKVVELGLANKEKEALVALKVAMPVTQEQQDLIHKAIKSQGATVKQRMKEADADYNMVVSIMIAVIVVAAILSLVISTYISRSITRPLTSAVSAAQAVAAGDLTQRIEVHSKDETGELMQALKNMNESLLNIVNQVRTGTDTIATASSQIAAGNQDLSSRTEQQASSLEETASSMEELTSTVRQNSENANQANQLAIAAADVAVKGGDVVSQVVDTMNSINDSSKKMADIINVIDGIAFQTNILALNAAVEAARAGEQGRGFAVVATEVRNLAQRSASAAREIKTLIDDSVTKVEQGSRLVNDAGTTMTEVVSSIKRVQDIMGEITAASREQTEGIEQVNQAVMQMDQVTQQNAALVEEAAAAAEAMQDQASNLVKQVSTFKTGQDFAVQSAPIKVAPRSSTSVSVRRTEPKRTAPPALPPAKQISPKNTGDDWEQF